jgi:hypothetical protein
MDGYSLGGLAPTVCIVVRVTTLGGSRPICRSPHTKHYIQNIYIAFIGRGTSGTPERVDNRSEIIGPVARLRGSQAMNSGISAAPKF